MSCDLKDACLLQTRCSEEVEWFRGKLFLRSGQHSQYLKLFVIVFFGSLTMIRRQPSLFFMSHSKIISDDSLHHILTCYLIFPVDLLSLFHCSCYRLLFCEHWFFFLCGQSWSLRSTIILIHCILKGKGCLADFIGLHHLSFSNICYLQVSLHDNGVNFTQKNPI